MPSLAQSNGMEKTKADRSNSDRRSFLLIIWPFASYTTTKLYTFRSFFNLLVRARNRGTRTSSLVRSTELMEVQPCTTC